MEKSLIVGRVETIAATVTKAAGLELVNVEIGGTKRDAVLRIFIDKEGGVTLDDCSGISRDIEAVLDEEDIIPSKYVLEVSSPGIERQLYKIGDFVRFKGQLARIKTKTEIDGQKAFVGTITDVVGEDIIFEDKTKGTITLPFDNVAKANLKIDLSKEFKGK